MRLSEPHCSGPCKCTQRRAQSINFAQTSKCGRAPLSMHCLHCVAIWTAAFAAATATGCFVASLLGAVGRMQALLTAELAVATGVAALLVSVSVDYLLARRQSRIGSAKLGEGGAPPAPDHDACLHKRREVLD